MEYTEKEKSTLKSTLLYLVKKKHKESGGHCGFHPVELLELLDELAESGEIRKRITIHNNQYFLTLKPNNDEEST